ncbi:CHAD domain-containing protein [Tabrizicola flagellatus]|uniref:CHAD domain-containing protein n=1 Tax=Tabrizicola flagellatus TaxID=2593021 RepID=UPI0011F19190|nr:CHAD domain-containing protein [Tabrizicola flagellatus]
MSYAFHRDDDGPEASLRRILDEELSSALKRLRSVSDPEAVHGIRKNLKKTRALLRLYRAGLHGQPAANAALREVAAALSARRDAAVRLATFDRLFPDLPETLSPLRAQLLSESLAPDEAPTAELAATLADLRDRMADWRLEGKPVRVLARGLAIARRRAQAAAEAARAAPDRPERVHDWRKRVKDLWYQSRLFAPVWPDLFRVLVAEADQLGETLGQHNDLAVLALHLQTVSGDVLPDVARALLATRIEDARTSILSRAFPASDRLLAGDPEAMADTWISWLKLWQRAA